MRAADRSQACDCSSTQVVEGHAFHAITGLRLPPARPEVSPTPRSAIRVRQVNRAGFAGG
jgi:hypothetical protein